MQEVSPSELWDFIGEGQWSDSVQCCKQNPTHASNKYGGQFPIHSACENKAPLDVIRCLHEAYDEGIRMPSNCGYLPLHCACIWEASLDVIKYLVEAYKEGIRTKTHDGELPIHKACQWDASSELIRYIHSLHPNGASVEDNMGNTPVSLLKCSLRSDAEKEEIREILLGQIQKSKIHNDQSTKQQQSPKCEKEKTATTFSPPGRASSAESLEQEPVSLKDSSSPAVTKLKAEIVYLHHSIASKDAKLREWRQQLKAMKERTDKHISEMLLSHSDELTNLKEVINLKDLELRRCLSALEHKKKLISSLQRMKVDLCSGARDITMEAQCAEIEKDRMEIEQLSWKAKEKAYKQTQEMLKVTFEERMNEMQTSHSEQLTELNNAAKSNHVELAKCWSTLLSKNAEIASLQSSLDQMKVDFRDTVKNLVSENQELRCANQRLGVQIDVLNAKLQ